MNREEAGQLIQVTFLATLKNPDSEYSTTATQLRVLALESYGCLYFESVSEGSSEIAISLWPDEQAVAAWRNDPLHQEAMLKGKDRWYDSYRVLVSRVARDYEF